MDLVAFPSQLPCPSPEGYQLRHVDPMVRTHLASGRARQRRRFTSVPTEIPVSWTFTQPQMQLFEVWYRYSIDDGALWFSVRLQTPLGIKDYRARFTGIYRADLLGTDYWRVTAEVELYERQTLPREWLEFPDYIVGSSIIDKAINREWPVQTWDYATYADALADFDSLTQGQQVTVQHDETQGGRSTRYRVYIAPQVTLSLDFVRGRYFVYDKDNSLELVNVYG